jgi:hypothetical protein
VSYQAGTINAAGLQVPSYNDIYNFYLAAYQTIYGQQVSTDNSNSDIQLISVLALALSDAYNALVLDYNNRSPIYAIGAALDSIVKINGLTRKTASFSTCTVVCSGTAFTVIPAGIVQDVNGNQWALPPNTEIGSGGSVSATATALVAGAITVGASQITTIVTVVSGWTGVTNSSNLPSVGAPTEADSSLRSRQSVSTELPSISIFAGTVAGVEAVEGVTNIQADENTTGSTDGNGTPGHSIQLVVQGGANLDIATAIYNNKSLGCGTYGSVNVPVTDPVTGIVTTINFNRPTLQQVYVKLGVTPLNGYTTATTAAILQAVLAYIAGLSIGQNVSYISVMAAAMSVAGNFDSPVFVIEVASSGIGTSSSPSGTTDITIAFGTLAVSGAENVIINT